METEKRNKTWIRVRTCLRMAVEIDSHGKGPGRLLSPSYGHSFVFDGVSCRSMAGFLQSLKCRRLGEQIAVCYMDGEEAGKFDKRIKGDLRYDIETHGAFWKGEPIDRRSEDYRNLLRKAYRAMFTQCPEFRKALLATGFRHLYYSEGALAPRETVITENELCEILKDLRMELVVEKIFDAGN